MSCDADSNGAAFLPLPARVVDDDDDADGAGSLVPNLRIADPALGTACWLNNDDDREEEDEVEEKDEEDEVEEKDEEDDEGIA